MTASAAHSMVDPAGPASSWSTRARAESPARRPASAAERERPQLYVVRSLVPSRTTLPFLLLIVVILAGALVSSMVLNAQMAETAYQMQEAQIELDVVRDHVETLRHDVQVASAPDSLAARAEGLGMVPAAPPGVVDLTTSTLAGGTPAKGE